jgi:hypothetical protein
LVRSPTAMRWLHPNSSACCSFSISSLSPSPSWWPLSPQLRREVTEARVPTVLRPTPPIRRPCSVARRRVRRLCLVVRPLPGRARHRVRLPPGRARRRARRRVRRRVRHRVTVVAAGPLAVAVPAPAGKRNRYVFLLTIRIGNRINRNIMNNTQHHTQCLPSRSDDRVTDGCAYGSNLAMPAFSPAFFKEECI